MASPKFEVLISRAATFDLQAISDFYLLSATDEIAEQLINQIENGFNSLSQFPERGTSVFELSSIGLTQYKQLLQAPFRIIYTIINRQVRVFMVLHQKQSIQKALLSRNLI